MNTLEIKDKILHKLEEIQDADILNNVLNFVETLKVDNNSKLSDAQLTEVDKRRASYMAGEAEIIAYSIAGEPISKKEYILRNEKALESYKKGNFKTQKELLKKYKKSI